MKGSIRVHPTQNLHILLLTQNKNIDKVMATFLNMTQRKRTALSLFNVVRKNAELGQDLANTKYRAKDL